MNVKRDDKDYDDDDDDDDTKRHLSSYYTGKVRLL